MSHPGLVQALPPPPHAKQSHQQQQAQQQPPVSLLSEAIEMRPTAGFTRLPQDLPAQTQFSPPMEMPLSNGVARRPTPDYQHPPSYMQEESQSQPFSHHHNYEELPIPLPLPPTETSTVDVVLDNRQGFHRQGSHTEVDQYYNPPVHSISSTPLTIAEPEKKPRKKVNPIYDRYQGPTERITTSKDGSQKTLKAKGQQRSFPWRCLRHPCTTAFIFVLVAVVIVAIVLIMLGTIETPVSVGTQDKQVQSTPKATLTPVTSAQPDINQELLALILEQKRTIDQLQIRVVTLENMLGGDSEVNASLSAKVAMNTVQVDTIDSAVTVLEDRITSFESTLSTTLVSLERVKTRTTAVETATSNLEVDVGALTALVTNHGIDILAIQEKNGEQDTAIVALQQDLSILDQMFGRELTVVNRTIYGELETISKMQGPRGFNGTDGTSGAPGAQGPPGAGDLSLCTYQMRSDTSTFNSYTFGVQIPTSSDKVITGFTCSTVGGTLANLASSETNGITSYRCECFGGAPTTAVPQRTCYTHYWDCPKTS